MRRAGGAIGTMADRTAGKGAGGKAGGFSIARVTNYYVPLFLQSFSQCLTYPLVASIVSGGPLGVHEITAFAQGQTVMFLLGAAGGGMVTTGMVFARTREGFRAFKRLNWAMIAALLALQAAAAIPLFANWMFGTVFNMGAGMADGAEMVEHARQTLLWSVFMQAAFFFRNLPLVALLNVRESGKANTATFVRIVLTLSLAPLFRRYGLVGHLWGLAATTVACWIETLVTWLYARPYIRALEPGGDPEDASALRQFAFTVPISAGGILLSFTPLLSAYFIGRAADSAAALSVHYLTVGLANAAGFGAFRMQQVAIQFPPERPRDFRVPLYALASGLCVACLPLAFGALHPVSEWYFCGVQGLSAGKLPMAETVMSLYAFLPVAQSLRACAEGWAARQKKPRIIFAGQAAYFATIVAALSGSLHFGMPGWYIGVTAILSAPAAAGATVAAGLVLANRRRAAA